MKVSSIYRAPGTKGTELATFFNEEKAKAILRKFFESLDIKENSKHTYALNLNQFFKWLAGRPIDNALTRGDIIAFKENLLSEGHTARTASAYLTTIRSFFKWAEAEGAIRQNIAAGVANPKRKNAFIKQHLSGDKAKELLAFFSMRAEQGTSNPAYINTARRDFAIVNLALRTGLRCIEICRANIGDVTYKGGRRVLNVWGKGRDEKDSFVVLSDKAFAPIEEYLKQDRPAYKDNEPLFASGSRRNVGGRLNTHSISRICKEGLRAIGLDGKEFTAHSLRHTAAVTILKNGGTIDKVQMVLRHASADTSAIYVKSIQEELRLQQAPELLIEY